MSWLINTFTNQRRSVTAQPATVNWRTISSDKVKLRFMSQLLSSYGLIIFSMIWWTLFQTQVYTNTFKRHTNIYTSASIGSTWTMTLYMYVCVYSICMYVYIYVQRYCFILLTVLSIITQACIWYLQCFCSFIYSFVFPSFFCFSRWREAGDIARLHSRGRRGLHREARHCSGSATQRGAGAGRPRAQHLVLEAGAQHAQSHRAASQTGRTGGEFQLSARAFISLSICLFTYLSIYI